MPAEAKPIFCYVTDRRAFEDTSNNSEQPGQVRRPRSARSLRDCIRDAVAAGANWIQIREKDLDGGALVELARFAIAETRDPPRRARVFVNDRLDAAVTAGAAGVHLGEKSLPLEAVAEWRRSAGRKEFLVGVSCHSLESARAAEGGGADYIFFGPIFATPSKAGFGAPQGIGHLREICASVKIPVLAIGGVNDVNARSCLEAGAAGFAAIRLFQEATDPAELAARLKAI